ncbi:hypothetical protein [Thalassospira xiamenensis]|uniref:Uncharacterized protein n=1 Tax=Thalassospira xiamenensis TaxID=220697 RepID=A0ABR5XZ57_9PROT|nr:hypothetical protein [Thalassospira xiamenensis]KZD00870.1 hypothetical protein AUP40_21350 [Thalassospira xiamenensis]KZD04134.1 hypothetical protein AUP45_21675 [Thalassospira xiamenensis]
MGDQILRLLSNKITDIDFRRDLRHQLRAAPLLEHAKLGWLDEGIARRFGFRDTEMARRLNDKYEIE